MRRISTKMRFNPIYYFVAASAIAAKTFLVLLISLPFGTRADAIQCAEIDFDESFEAASQVVTQSVPGSMSIYMLSFSVLDVLKGPGLKKVELNLDQERYLDPYTYAAGEKYLMFLEVGQKEIHICEKIVPIDNGARSWYSALQDSETSVIAQAIACVKRSPDAYQSVGGSALKLGAADAKRLDHEKNWWLVSIPEDSPTTLPHGLDLFVDAETGDKPRYKPQLVVMRAIAGIRNSSVSSGQISVRPLHHVPLPAVQSAL